MPGVICSARASSPTSGGCWWTGLIDLIRRVGREETVVARMDVPGRWAGGFRAWDEHGVYLATGRGVQPGRVLRVPAEVLRDRANAWFPFGGHLIAGCTAPRARSSPPRGSASPWSPWAPWRRAWRTRSTTRRRPPPGRSMPWMPPASAAVGPRPARRERLSRPRQFAALDALRREIEPRAVDLDPLERADREQALSAWLAGHGVERAWTIAPALAAAGVDLGWCERVAGVLEGPGLESGLEWLANTLSATTLLTEAKESTRRISELVAAVRSYSQMDRASLQRIDVTEGLDTTLVVLSHKFSDDVTVVRDYGADVPRIEAYAGELNQVWTNLIDNAARRHGRQGNPPGGDAGGRGRRLGRDR